MPRKAREKNSQSIYHIICRSISEFLLYRDDSDKNYYLLLLKRYTDRYQCSLYAYCLMDNHVHLHLDPRGFDVSKFMHSINTAYVKYYNKKYSRHGHVFQDRFESRILFSDAYNLTVSAYIHNNPHNIEGFSRHEETYKYSSYGIYLGTMPDLYKLVDKSFIMGLFNISNLEAFAISYYEFASHQHDIEKQDRVNIANSTLVSNEYISGRKIILREHSVVRIISFISDKLMVKSQSDIATKARHKFLRYRAFTAYVLRVLCGLGYKEICNCMFNMTISGCSRLCNRGYMLLNSKAYLDIFNDLINCSILI